MRMFITRAQYQALEALIELEAQKIDQSGKKFTSRAYINTSVLISFENHKPVSFKYNDHYLGIVQTTRSHEDDKEWYVWNREFDLFAEHVPRFQLLFGQSSDGVATTQTAVVTLDFSMTE